MKKVLSFLLALCLLCSLTLTASAATRDVSTLDGFLSKLILSGYFYDYDCDTINEKEASGVINYYTAVMKVFSSPSCIDMDAYDMAKNHYGLRFANEGNYRTLPLTDAKWLYQNIFNWSDATWENMLAYAQSRGGYLDSGRQYVYIKNGKLYCMGADRGDWPNRLETLAKRQNGNRIEVVLNWYTTEDYYGTPNMLKNRIYAEVEQKDIGGKNYWTVYRTKKLGTSENPLAVGGFDDVVSTDYYADPVVWAVGNGITNGVAPRQFNPKGACTRGHIVTFLWRACGSPEPETAASSFSDVQDTNQYYYKAVLWASENGITSGTGDGKFSPNKTCTRDQAVTFLWRSQGEPEAAPSSAFTDVKAGSFYEDAVNWAVANGVTSGTGSGKFSPGKTCTRGDIVTFLYRAEQ